MPEREDKMYRRREGSKMSMVNKMEKANHIKELRRKITRSISKKTK
jgi:hypothetical protein